MALAALVAFNLLRALVLTWLRSQPRPPAPRPVPAAPSRGKATGGAAWADSPPTGAGAPAGQQRPGAGPALEGRGAARTAAAPASAMIVDVEPESMPRPDAGPTLHGPEPEAGAGEDAGAGAGLVSSRSGATEGGATASEAPVVAGGRPPGRLRTGTSAAAMTAAAEEEEEELMAQGDVAEEQQAVQGAGSVQTAGYRLRPRGAKSNTNLGRVVLCATLLETGGGEGGGGGGGGGPPADVLDALGRRAGGAGGGAAASNAPSSAAAAAGSGLEWHRRFWEPLLDKYAGGPDGRVTGLLVAYRDCVLHVLEGDNNQLFALLRELRPKDVQVHRLAEVRVPCYVLDARERLFDSWLCANAQRPTGRRLRYHFSGATSGAAAPPGFGLAGGDGLLSGGTADAEAAGATSPEQRLVSRIQQVELFAKLVGPKLSSLTTLEARRNALQSLADAVASTPREADVSALATDPLAPSLPYFIDTFDLDYRRYVALLVLAEEAAEEAQQAAKGPAGQVAAAAAEARLGTLAGDLRHLSQYYSEHVRRDLQEALADRQGERGHISAGAVAQRLSRGMQLSIQPWQEGAQYHKTE